MEANKVILNGEVIVDLTGDTAEENDVQLGKTFHKADGTLAEGTYVPEVQPLNVSANGTYEPSGSIVGYAPVVVNVEGSGGGTVPKKVDFYDYDGTLLYTYTVEEAKSLAELPPLPEHAGLVCQGWNYTLEYLQNNDDSVVVGAMYITDDGATRLYLHFDGNERLTQPLAFDQSVAGGVAVDWGDGSEYDTSTSTGTVKLSHTYAEGNRDYVIRLLRVKSDCEITFPFQIFYRSAYSVVSTRLFKVEMGTVGDQAFISGAFHYCSGLETITLPSNITHIPTYAIRGCSALKCVVIPNSVTSISSNACSECSSLRTVSVSDSVTSIGSYAFGGCSSLTSISIPTGVTSISSSTFDYCYSLTSVNIPDSVTSIGGSAFNSCHSLMSISIPDSVTKVGERAFDGCSSITSINIPSGTTSIGTNMFRDCYSLTSVNIPDSVTSIDSYAFTGCSALKSINIPNGVTRIGSYAFRGCSSLARIDLPDSVTSIDSYAFSSCYSLMSINIPNGVTGISSSTFYYCYSLTSIVIPGGVTSIDSSAFYYCSSLSRVVVKAGTPPTLQRSSFGNLPSDCVIEVPAESLDSYKTATNWSTYANQIVAIKEES